jgi:hypothetical protein
MIQDGRHSESITANPSPHLPANGNNNPTGASPAKAAGSMSAPTSNAQAASSPHDNANPAVGGPGAANYVQRPNTAPVSFSEQDFPSSMLAPNLDDNLDFTPLDFTPLISGSGLDSLEGFLDFEGEFGQ